MSARYFLDSNVIVYAFNKSSPEKQKIARRLIIEGVTGKQAVVSYQVVQEFVNMALHQFESNMSTDGLEEFLLGALFPMMAVSSSPTLIGEALRLQTAHRISWYDSLIVAAAIEGGCSVLHSESFPHGKRFGDLVVQNPFL